MSIQLSQAIQIAKPTDYKLHLACWNGTNQPLDVFVRDWDEWVGWNRWRGVRDEFSRAYIFSLIQFYHEPDRWLFGGIFRILRRRAKNRAPSYDVELVPDSAELVGRLKLILKRPARAKAVNLENHYQNLIVAEVLPTAYSGATFPGFDSIDISFAELQTIVVTQRADWKAALQHAKGVYVVTDTLSGKRYVGSAYGAHGLWSRWECYAGTGHGYSDDLTGLIRAEGMEYVQAYFRFALLEQRTMKTSDDVVIAREVFWKKVLLSRGPFGYNKN
jgi:hypothetical protein